jgi:hypothetical protein
MTEEELSILRGLYLKTSEEVFERRCPYPYCDEGISEYCTEELSCPYLSEEKKERDKVE